MNSDAKKTREQRLDESARELRRIEQATPAYIESARFISGQAGGRAFILFKSNPGMVDKRGPVLRWLVPRRSSACRIRLDPYGAFVAGLITGRRSTVEIMKAFQNEFKREPAESREACLLFLRSLAKRGVICIVEKDR